MKLKPIPYPLQLVTVPLLRHQIETAAKEISDLTAKLESTKEGKRAVQAKLDAMAPLQCETCDRAMWPEDQPHVHFTGRHLNKRYTAKKVPRK